MFGFGKKKEENQQAEPPKSRMEELNEQTKSEQLATNDDNLKGIKVMKGVFDGYKIGDEDDFLNEAEPEEEESIVDEGLEKADNASTTTGFIADTYEKINDKVGSWSEGNGIVGAALTIIKNVKEAYGKWKEKSDNKDDDELEGSDSGAAKLLETAEAIFKIIDAAGVAVKGILKAIPVIGFIFDAIDIAKESIRIIKSDISRVKMNNSRRLFKEKYLNKEVPTEDDGPEKKMIKKVKWYNVRRFWKKTDITFDEETLKARRDFLIAQRDKSDEKILPPDLEEELQDIMRFLVQDRLRRLRRNDELKGAGKIVMTLGKIAGKIASLGASSAAEMTADTIGYASDAAGLTAMVSEYTIKKYQKRGGRNKGQQYTRYLLEIIGHLPADYENENGKMEYVQTLDMVTATGVDSEELYDVSKKASSENQKKNKASAYNMFIDLFEG